MASPARRSHHATGRIYIQLEREYFFISRNTLRPLYDSNPQFGAIGAIGADKKGCSRVSGHASINLV
jgi:hypothetical protein